MENLTSPAETAPVLVPEFQTKKVKYSNIDHEIIEWEYPTASPRVTMDRDNAIKHAIQILAQAGVSISGPDV